MSSATDVDGGTFDSDVDTVIKEEIKEEMEAAEENEGPLVSPESYLVVELNESSTGGTGESSSLHGCHDNPWSEETERSLAETKGSMATAIIVPKQCPGPFEAISEAESNYRYHCLICYKEYFGAEHVENEDLEAQAELYNVFCKYLQIQRGSDHNVESQLFCKQCAVAMRTLLGFDAELETLRLKTKKIAVNCTAKLLESYNPRAKTIGNRMVDTIRSQVFRRYNPRVSLTDRNRAESGGPDQMRGPDQSRGPVQIRGPDQSHGPDQIRGPDLFGESDWEMGGGPTDDEDTMNDPCDGEILVISDPDTEVYPPKLSLKSPSPPKTRKGLVARSTALRAKEKISAPFPKVYCNPRKPKSKRGRSRREQAHRPTSKKVEVVVTIHDSKRSLRSNAKSKRRSMQAPAGKTVEVPGTNLTYQEVSRGSYIYAKKFPFEALGASKVKCRICFRAYPSDHEMILHIQRSHIGMKAKNSDDPDDVIYDHGIRVERREGYWHCKECNFKRKKKNEIKNHVTFGHYIRKLKESKPTTENDLNSTQPTTYPVNAGRSGVEVTTDPTSVEAPATSDVTHAQGDADQAGDPAANTEADDHGDDYTEPEDVSEGEVEDDGRDSDYIPDDVIKEAKIAEREKNTRVKERGPGKYIYGEKFEFEKTGEEAWTCGTCRKRVKTKAEIINHVRRHYYLRDADNKNFKTVDIGDNQLLYANQYFIDKVGDQFSCRECGFLHPEKNRIREHIRYKHMPREKEDETLMCEECGKIFNNSAALRGHMKRMHEESETPQICPTCGKGYRNAKLLRIHVRGHLGVKLKNFICEHCGKAFDSRVKLVSHSSSHTGEKPFQCQYCLQSFGAYTVMVVHRKHHCDKNPQRTQQTEEDLQQALIPEVEERNAPEEQPPVEQPPPPLQHCPDPMNYFPPLFGSFLPHFKHMQ